MEFDKDTKLKLSTVKLDEFDKSRIIFSEPIEGTIPGSDPKKKDASLKYNRIKIGYSKEGKDNTSYPSTMTLITPKFFSFGVSENKFSPGDYTISITFWEKDKEPTTEQRLFLEIVESIIASCSQHLTSIKSPALKKKIGTPTFNTVYQKDNNPPSMYPKLRCIIKDGQKVITTHMNDMYSDREYSLDEVLDRRCHAVAAIEFDSIFIGTKVSIQVKIRELSLDFIPMKSLRLIEKEEKETFDDDDIDEDEKRLVSILGKSNLDGK